MLEKSLCGDGGLEGRVAVGETTLIFFSRFRDRLRALVVGICNCEAERPGTQPLTFYPWVGAKTRTMNRENNECFERRAVQRTILTRGHPFAGFLCLFRVPDVGGKHTLQVDWLVTGLRMSPETITVVTWTKVTEEG